jgi:hypothetical protein
MTTLAVISPESLNLKYTNSELKMSSKAMAVPLKRDFGVPFFEPAAPRPAKPVPQQWEPQQREVLKYMIKNAFTFERIRREEIIPKDIPDLQSKIESAKNNIIEVNRKEIQMINDF